MIATEADVVEASASDAAAWFAGASSRGELPGRSFNWAFIILTLGNRARVGRESTDEERLEWADLLHQMLEYVGRAGIIASERTRHDELWLRSCLIHDFGATSDGSLREAVGLARAFFAALGPMTLAEASARVAAFGYGYDDRTDCRLRDVLRIVEPLDDGSTSSAFGEEFRPWIALASSLKRER